MWERGLKRFINKRKPIPKSVAPHVGAWIETPSLAEKANLRESLPMWERGLKQQFAQIV